MDGGSWVMWNNWWINAWTWRQFPNTFSLGAGNHTLTIAYREDGARLDKLNVTTSTAAPTGTGSMASNCATGTTLSVSPATVNVAATASSSGTALVTSNANWGATDDQDWLTVSPESGSGNGTLKFTAQANATATARTATVTVSATGVAAQTVSVVQAGNRRRTGLRRASDPVVRLVAQQLVPAGSVRVRERCTHDGKVRVELPSRGDCDTRAGVRVRLQAEYGLFRDNRLAQRQYARRDRQ